MSKIAVIKTGGKQYKIREGEELKIEKLEGNLGDKIKFEVLLTADEEGSDVQIGKPFLSSKIDAEIIEQGRNKKILIIKYKPKVRYAKKKGHRQQFTKIKISKI